MASTKQPISVAQIVTQVLRGIGAKFEFDLGQTKNQICDWNKLGRLAINFNLRCG